MTNRMFTAVTVVLAIVAAATANVRSHSHSTGLAVASSAMSIAELTVDTKKFPIEDFDDRSLVFPRGTDR
jgi:hypothetical protein